MKQKFLIGILTIIFIVLIFGITVFFLINSQKKSKFINNSTNSHQKIVGNDRDEHGCIGSAGYQWCEEKNKCLREWEESCVSIPTSSTNTENNSNTKTESQFYRNNEFGFEFTIPTGYSDWKAMLEKDYGGPGVSYIHILFKTNDPDWTNLEEENFVTGEKFPGYSSIFAFTVWEKTAYQKKLVECQKTPDPSCPGTILGSNDKYIFDLNFGNGIPPKDLEKLAHELKASPDIKTTLEFKTFNQ